MSAEIDTLHAPFIAWLKREKIPYVNSRPDRESTIAEGWPDFTLVLGNRCLMIEFKDKEGKVSAAQKARVAELEAAGNLVLVLRDLGAALAVVEHWRAGIGEIIPRPTTKAEEPAHQERQIGGSIYRLNPACGRWEFVRLVAPASSAAPPASPPISRGER